MERDARELPLRPDPESIQKERDRRDALANRFYACFTEYPEVLQEIRRMGGVDITLLATKKAGDFDPDLTLVRLGGRELVTLIDGMVMAGRLGSEERTQKGPLQRIAGCPMANAGNP